MPSPGRLEQLQEWIEFGYHEPRATPNFHCLRVFRSVPLPDGRILSAVSIRHETPRAAQAPDLFVAELWNLSRWPIRPSDVEEMCLALAAFRAMYSGILEEAELGGQRRRHRFSVHGNLVGPGVEPAAMVDLLSHHGREVAFWTPRPAAGRTEFEPYVAEEQHGPPSVLSRMLDHLAWEGPGAAARSRG